MLDGILDVSRFVIGSGAADKFDRIIYNSATGELSYDRDGLGGLDAKRFAWLDAGLALTNADFLVN